MDNKRRVRQARRKRSRATIKALSRKLKYIYGLSLISILIFTITMGMIFMGMPTFSKGQAGIGVLFLLASVMAIYYSVKGIKESEDTPVAKIISVVLPVISFVLWGYIYVIGFIHM